MCFFSTIKKKKKACIPLEWIGKEKDGKNKIRSMTEKHSHVAVRPCTKNENSGTIIKE